MAAETAVALSLDISEDEIYSSDEENEVERAVNEGESDDESDDLVLGICCPQHFRALLVLFM